MAHQEIPETQAILNPYQGIFFPKSALPFPHFRLQPPFISLSLPLCSFLSFSSSSNFGVPFVMQSIWAHSLTALALADLGLFGLVFLENIYQVFS